jgi:hypothetical protein
MQSVTMIVVIVEAGLASMGYRMLKGKYFALIVS